VGLDFRRFRPSHTRKLIRNVLLQGTKVLKVGGRSGRGESRDPEEQEKSQQLIANAPVGKAFHYFPPWLVSCNHKSAPKERHNVAHGVKPWVGAPSLAPFPSPARAGEGCRRRGEGLRTQGCALG